MYKTVPRATDLVFPERWPSGIRVNSVEYSFELSSIMYIDLLFIQGATAYESGIKLQQLLSSITNNRKHFREASYLSCAQPLLAKRGQ